MKLSNELFPTWEKSCTNARVMLIDGLFLCALVENVYRKRGLY